MGGIPCIIPSVVLHIYVRRSQILLTFNRHQMMHSVFCIVPCVVVACKGLFLIQKHSEEQGQALYSLPALFWTFASFQSV